MANDNGAISIEGGGIGRMDIVKVNKHEFLQHYKKGLKYKNVKTILGGILYDSKREAGFAMELEIRRKAKEIVAWNRQVKYPITVNGKKICTYVVDFVVIHADRSVEAIEVKGYPTKEWILKRKLFEALYPDIIYTVVK